MHCLTYEEQQQSAIAELRCQHKRIKVLRWRLWCGRGQWPRQQALDSIHFLPLKILLTLQIPVLNANHQLKALHCCLAKLNANTQKQVALVETHLVTKWRNWLAATSEDPEDQMLIRCVLSKTCNSFARHKQDDDENKACSAHPSPFLTPGCHKIRNQALGHPLLW